MHAAVCTCSALHTWHATHGVAAFWSLSHFEPSTQSTHCWVALSAYEPAAHVSLQVVSTVALHTAVRTWLALHTVHCSIPDRGQDLESLNVRREPR